MTRNAVSRHREAGRDRAAFGAAGWVEGADLVLSARPQMSEHAL
ncbi:hypothetical protein ACIPSA_27960 [Streptomyces sp. NPDC086549]